MLDDHHASFRQCSCQAPGCGVVFYICPHCERGQVYCSDSCRQLARRIGHRIANRRHQQSEEGRLDHNDRQRAYRLRQARASSQSGSAKSVTDHTYAPSPSYATLLPPASTTVRGPLSKLRPALRLHARSFSSDRQRVVCLFCGRRGRFLNPFHERN